ncbi:MAG: glycosyltransferase [Desulfomicrobium apsheronum]|nr:glycosyltransferase [Desulfomicrobium apsheronum]
MNYAAKLGVSDRVCMPGYCENTPELYANLFDAFCLPSFAEGFPNVLIEAVLSGLFCVCSNNITKDITNSLSKRINTLSLKANIDQWANMIEFSVKQKKSFDDGVIYIKRSKFTVDNQISTLINIYNNSVL